MLLQKANEDEALLDEVLTSDRVSDPIIGFHCQQAAEKLLKAMLSNLGVQFPRTHNLRALVDLLLDAGHSLPPGLKDLDVLTPYGTLLRYEYLPPEKRLDRVAAREMVRALREHVRLQLG